MSRLIGPESEIVVPLLSPEQAGEFALEYCQFFEFASSKPYVFFAKSTYALLFESAAKAKGEFNGNQYYSGENSDLYWQRYCLMNAQAVEVDSQGLPDFENSIFFQQVESIKDSIKVNKIELTAETTKQANSESEAPL